MPNQYKEGYIDAKLDVIKIVEDQITIFSSTGYATDQPFASHAERFACGRVLELVRELKA